ncbi:hypothetical protein [Winogradskyella psychrotolerans]|nr:hypothetical protein [Winogradskyella psychrotolerans]
MRRLYFIVLLLLSSLVYGQKSVLLQNVNNRAKELQHHLNKTEDSIIFKSERTIYEIMIFNDDFERIIKVKDTNAKLLIADIPVGRYAVEAVLIDKLIVITLLRNESFNLQKLTPLLTTTTSPYSKDISPSKVVSTVKKEPFGSENNTGRTDLSLSGKTATPFIKEEKSLTLSKGFTSKTSIRPRENAENTAKSTYWVIHKINNGSSSEKILKIVDQKTVDRMIQKNEIDMKTFSGRLNELTVWQIHNTTGFVQHKRRNKTNYMNIESDSFNFVPYYKTDHNLDRN